MKPDWKLKSTWMWSRPDKIRDKKINEMYENLNIPKKLKNKLKQLLVIK